MRSPRLSFAVRTGLIVTGLAAVLALALWPYFTGALQNVCFAAVPEQAGRCANLPNTLLGYVLMLAAYPLILVLERVKPAKAAQDLVSASLLVDFFWFCCAPLFVIAFIIPANAAMSFLYSDYLSMEKISILSSLPLAAQFAVVILISDFLAWFAHVTRHKVDIIWEFHKTHHSQDELNVFTTSRLHPGDLVWISIVKFLPFAMLDLKIAVPAFIVWQGIARVYAMFTHSNVKTNLGPLKYVLVTPQSHRIHHSSRPEHQDLNFGETFSVWDFIFGTQYMDFDAYPETGINDEGNPKVQHATVAGAFVTFCDLMLYPFKTLRRKYSW